MASRSPSSKSYQTAKRQFQVVLFLLVGSLTGTANALITGGTGNAPVPGTAWPDGAAAIFNDPSRVAWWAGPPFGGGHSHAECRGNTEALNAILVRFAKLKVTTKRLVVQDGVGHSFWLNPKREEAKRQAAQFDWEFMVWSPESWARLSKFPADINSINPADRDKGPPVEMEVYTGGNIRWADVVVPDGIEVIDNRLEAHGFSPEEGAVLEGTVVDLATDEPIAGQIELQSVEPKKTGGYDHSVVTTIETDDGGKWVLKNAPAGWHRVVARAEGYVPRVVGYLRSSIRRDTTPRWHSYEAALAKPGLVAGRVTDTAGKPLADVGVRLGNVDGGSGGRYDSPVRIFATTDASGEFRIEGAPVGSATVHIHKPGYVRPGLGMDITVPTENMTLQMKAAAQLNVVVLFRGTEIPDEYIVNIKPEGGNIVGSWSGSSKIDDLNQVTLKNIPPGKYVLQGHPNPTNEEQKTRPQTIELKGGKTTRVEITAF